MRGLYGGRGGSEGDVGRRRGLEMDQRSGSWVSAWTWETEAPYSGHACTAWATTRSGIESRAGTW